jgi:hypothetical protein
MRAWELLVEFVESDFDSDLEDLLIAAKANGITEIEVDPLVDQLNAMGYSVTPDSLISAIEQHDHEFIKNATLNTITFNDHMVDDEGGDDWEDEEVDAEKLATRTAMKDVKGKQDNKKQMAKDALD